MTLERYPLYSFEYFPPGEAEEARCLYDVGLQLASLGPDFFSVTFGAGGGTRRKTLETVLELQRCTGIQGAPHISCIGSSRAGLLKTLGFYRQANVRRLVALRGDRVSGVKQPGNMQYANQLVELVRREHGDYFHIQVAAYPECHPEAPNASTDLENFRRKVEAGADGALTQYFYSADAYFRFLDSCARVGIEIPIVPGIMPITNYVQLVRFSKNCGADIPRWMLMRMQDLAGDLPALRAFGVDVVSELCTRLLRGGAPGLHFYTLNRAQSCLQIWKQLGLDQRERQYPAAPMQVSSKSAS